MRRASGAGLRGMSGFFNRLSSYFSGDHSTDSAAVAGNKYFLANVEELSDGQMKEIPFETDGRTMKVLLSKVQGVYYATSHLCPHYKARLVTGSLSSNGRLTCPWHAACFNVKTGDIEEAPSVEALRSYPLTIEDGKIYLRATGEELQTPIRSACAHVDISEEEMEQDGRTFVIIGGGAAGAIAAESMRNAGFRGRVVVFSKEPYLPIDRVKLSKFLDVNLERISLYKAPYLKQLAIEYNLGKAVTGVNREKKEVYLDDNTLVKYSKLLIATGGEPRRLPIPGANLEGVFVIRGAQDNERILAAMRNLKERKPKVVIIGASFIGMESAAMMVKISESVTVVGMETTPLDRVLGAEVGGVLRRLHEKNGVKFHLGTGITKIDDEADRAAGVELSDGTRLPADIVILGVGVQPATTFLRDSFPLERDGSIKVDKEMRSVADEHIYAAGDMATFPQYETGKPVRIEHWDVAQQQGRIAGHNMGCGDAIAKKTYKSVPFFFSFLFGRSVRYAGDAYEGYDRIHIDGDLQSDDFTFAAYYLKADKAVAVATMGRDPLAVHCSELMLQDRMPSAAKICSGTDPLSIPL